MNLRCVVRPSFRSIILSLRALEKIQKLGTNSETISDIWTWYDR